MQHSFWNHMEFLWNFRHYFGEYPLQNDGHNWLRRMHNSFISDKKWNISLEKELVSRIYTTKKEDWTFPIGILHVSIKWSSILMEHSFFDPRFDINSAYQNSGCKLKSTLHMVQDYCLSFGRKMQFSKRNAASCQGFLHDL